MATASGHEFRGDVCVVGSGAGGAAVAAELALAGASVAVLEAGGEAPLARIGEPELKAAVRAATGGAFVVSPGGWLPPKIVLHGRCEGGSTAINTGNSFRVPEFISSRWRKAGVPDLGDYYGRVDTFLQVAKADPTLLGKNGDRLLRGIQTLGWNGGPMPRNAPGCTGRAICILGCPEQAKRSTNISYLPVARKHGASVHLKTRVTRIRFLNQRACGVEAVNAEGKAVSFVADKVVVSGGSLFTPALLERSGVKVPHLGEHLSIHPACLMLTHFADGTEMGYTSIPQSVYCDQFLESEGFLLVNNSIPQPLLMPLLAGIGRIPQALDFRRAGIWAALVHDEGISSVHATKAGGHKVIYRVDETLRRTMRRAWLRLAEAAFAAGATGVTPVMLGTGTFQSLDELDRWLPEAPPENRLIIAGFHPMGTCGIGRVCDGDGRVRGYENLYVADASLFPSASGVTPQMSVMAMATAVASGLLENN